MSAIFGIYHRDRNYFDSAQLGKTEACLRHLGPDRAGFWNNRVAGLGHVMLLTMAESMREELPFQDKSGRYVITGDARLDNREDLIRTLEPQQGGASISDAELILESYRKWGERCPERLMGDFAFVIWDEVQQTMFCARDRFGVKPFCYFLSDRMFIFATQPKGVLESPEVPQRINWKKVAVFLGGDFPEEDLTFYEDVHRLPAAHWMRVGPTEVRREAYWQLDFSRELPPASDEEYAAEFRRLLERSVRERLRTTFRPGCMLSGGLDSSSLTCLADRMFERTGKHQLATFSAVFKKVTNSDESIYIQEVLKKVDCESFIVTADDLGPFHELEQMMWHLDAPLGAGNLYITWAINQLARQQGVRVILDGYDGDTTVSHGHGYLIELARAGRWLTLAREVKQGSQYQKSKAWAPRVWSWYRRYRIDPFLENRPFLVKLLKSGRLAVRGPAVAPARPRVAAGYSGILRDDFLKEIGLADPRPKAKGSQNEREDHFRTWQRPILRELLETLAAAGAAFGIDVRFPFMEKELVEFCLALPANQKMRGGFTRYVMRNAMEGILPPAIQWRGGKGDLTFGFEEGLRQFDQGVFEGAVLNKPGLLENCVNLPVLKQAYDRFRERRASVNDVMAIKSALILNLWAQKRGL